MNQICDKNSCTGCNACLNICPTHCISTKEDAYGFLYPHIDSNTCIDCGLCVKVCPSNNNTAYYQPTNVYAAINKNKFDYSSATSGGIATLLSRKIIEKNGVVYGVAFSKELNAHHIRVDKADDIEKIKGSKYIQSDTGDTFSKVKQDLNNDNYVLYVGTPCQIAGLRNYLGKDYPKLLMCDLVCHGTPAAKLLKEHLNSVSNIEQIEKISFRDKEGYYLSVFNNNDIIYRKRNFKDVFYLGFLKSLFCRESCCSCKYAKPQRVSDITLGDFWGFDSQKGKFPTSAANGLSLVMINTEKGKSFFNECKEDMIFIERTLEEAVVGNKQLRHPSVKHKNHSRFCKQYLSHGFKKAANNALVKERIVYGILDRIGK